jgi:hypothetical protein
MVEWAGETCWETSGNMEGMCPLTAKSRSAQFFRVA